MTKYSYGWFKIPTSILKRTSDSYQTQRKKTERRVRFSEPENTIHGKNTVKYQAICGIYNKLSLSVNKKSSFKIKYCLLIHMTYTY